MSMFNSPGKSFVGGGPIDQYDDVAQQLPPIGVLGLSEVTPATEEPLLQETRRRNQMFASPSPQHSGLKKDFFNPTPRNSLRLRPGRTGHPYEQNLEQDQQETPPPEEDQEHPNPTSQMLDFSLYDDHGPKTPQKINSDDLEGKQSTASNSYRKTLQTIPPEERQKVLIPMLHESLSSKGLKNLSESVRRAVGELGQATYKEVANILIKTLQRQNLITDSFRDEQNIKRRVYDALNVFVSANVINKEGKYVSIRHNKQPRLADLVKEKEELREALVITEMNIREKYMKFLELRNRFLANEYLIARNKETHTPANSRIQFPFVATISDSLPQMVRSNSNGCNVKLLFRSSGCKVQGDMDMVMQLGFHETGRPTKLHRRFLNFALEGAPDEGFSPFPATPSKQNENK